MTPTNRCEMNDLGEGAEMGLAWQQRSLSYALLPAFEEHQLRYLHWAPVRDSLSL